MELIDHTESGVAFELLCDQLYEYADEVELLISEVVYRDIQTLGVYFGFTKDTWEPLASFVVEPWRGDEQKPTDIAVGQDLAVKAMVGPTTTRGEGVLHRSCMAFGTRPDP